ncbi:MAG: aminopeptidase N C-terminal domain-containing protein, partial [Planctomycetes bacterium]|nr:aminopeptidase N C-terminal domain-containing protein [Planctomycetota bacterium]
LAGFERRWAKEPLVMDKWFALQMRCDRPGRADDLRRLREHPAWTRDNPNRVRALIGAFAGTPQHFHALDGSGYELLAEEIVLIDAQNPQLAARLASPFASLRRQTDARRALMRAVTAPLLERPTISGNLREVLGLALDSSA